MGREEHSGDVGKTLRDLRKACGASQFEVVERVKIATGNAISQAKLSLFEAGHRGVSSDELDAIGEAIEDSIIENWDGLRNRAELIELLADWLLFQEWRHFSEKELSTSDVQAAVRSRFPEGTSSRIRFFGAPCGEEIPLIKSNVWKRVRGVRGAILEKKVRAIEQELALKKKKLALLTREALVEAHEYDPELDYDPLIDEGDYDRY